ncbi:MAG: hypothetical protein A2V81_00485 [Candidatus Abawacabacteria bacterium RBG_16_42_10]|uniref:Phosphatidylglycerol--prolipoprotein diacylglyceryl transferase n=1 Tax=Candidatus Abawacabacteria bacterium RBG_16_42_10 TaxID=1817814 RepID=A0A1F4XKT3_9BACT|nr:MAG: hypothetical protein A2V81_00485 [Candidatus Abawacabacteria bacterium RBG_16_42_10]
MNPFRIHFSLFDQAFTIGPYTIFFFLALATVVIGGIIFAARRGFDRKKVTIIMLVMLVSSVVGARLLNALVNFPAYWENPAKLFAFDASGFSLYGGIAMAIISGLISCHFLRLNIFKLGDTLIPFLGIGIGIMRIGCFMNGCCFGKETDLPWGVHFPFLSPAHLYQLSNGGSFLEVDGVHPTQLYELVAAFSLSAIAFTLLKKKTPEGMTMLIFLMGFSLFRLINSYLRVNPGTFSVSPYFYPAIYLLIIAVCSILFIRSKQKTAAQAI